MLYMLDTNTCIAIIKNRPERVKKKLQKVAIGSVAISSIVLAELSYGVALSQKKKHNQQALDDFLDYVAILDWSARAAPGYGEIRAYLKNQGTPIGAMDLLIAAHAVMIKAVLVTDNLREFQRVPGLKLEDWLK